MKATAIIQARMNSSRLPGKVLMPLGDESVIQRIYRLCQSIPNVDNVIIATSQESSDDPLVDFCESHQLKVFRGSLDNVLDRFWQCKQSLPSDYYLRITGDCPLLDPQVCGGVLQLAKAGQLDYAANTLTPSWPDGLDCEVIHSDTLDRVHKDAKSPMDFEHVTYHIHTRRHAFKMAHFDCPIPQLHQHRWTLDTPEDYDFISRIVNQVDSKTPSYLEILSLLEKQPNLLEINQGFSRNESITQQTALPHYQGFSNSTAMLNKAEKTIPLGSQTFSKSKTQYPVGHAPLFASHGAGAHLFDVDGNRYVDLVNALLPNLLGYDDADVRHAIGQQLANGISFSLASTLEQELAETLQRLIPCAEMCRFGKNGSDATSACIRLARAHTGRDRVISIGYHGWHDWYIGATSMHKGIPKAVQALTHTAPYNDLAAVKTLLDAHPGEFACLIMEPMNVESPDEGYLEAIKDLVHQHGALLIFDEIITGFRFDIGGAQRLFGVTPDLASFGKSLGNGMPISVVAGKAEIMQKMEDIFFSGTFGGETLSLVAALAVLKKLQTKPVIETLYKTGTEIAEKVTQLFTQFDLQNIIQLKGNPTWKLLQFSPTDCSNTHEIKTFLLFYLIQSGVLCIGSHNICYAHTPQDSQHIISAYALALEKLKTALDRGPLAIQMPCDVIAPLFQVRKTNIS